VPDEDAEQRRVVLVGSVITLILVIIIAGAYYFSSRPDVVETRRDSTATTIVPSMTPVAGDTNRPIDIEPSYPPVDTAVAANPPPERTFETKPRNVARDDSLVLEAVSSTPVWFSIKMDTTRTERGTLVSNDHRTWKAKDRFTVTLGDAGVVTFFLNGRELGSLGEEGSVVKNVVISRDNLGRAP
jgi:hypothetical protein